MGSSDDCFTWTKRRMERYITTKNTMKKNKIRCQLLQQPQHSLSKFYTLREMCECALCADTNCPEWKALHTEARSCFHHIIQVHTHSTDPTRLQYIRSDVCYAGRWLTHSLFPRIQFTHCRGISLTL